MKLLERIFRAAEDENRRVILETMAPRPGARFLDLGCGDGEWTMSVANHVGAREVHGVEMVDELGGLARSRGVEVLRADLSEPLRQYADESFDVIHSNQVIEHLRGTDCFMDEVRRLLRPDGYAMISTNNLSSWHNILSLVVGWQPLPCNVSDRVNLGNPLNPCGDCEHGFPRRLLPLPACDRPPSCECRPTTRCVPRARIRTPPVTRFRPGKGLEPPSGHDRRSRPGGGS